MAAPSGVAAGATAGGLVGGLVGLGIPEYEAKAYEERIKKGGFLMAVHVDDNKNADDTREIMERNGLEDISSVSEKYPFEICNDNSARRSSRKND